MPILDAHENQRAQGLCRSDAVAARVRFFQTTLQIHAHEIDRGSMLLQEVSDPLQSRIEMDAVTLQLEIGEAELKGGEAAHFCFSARSSSRLISQMRSKEALSLR